MVCLGTIDDQFPSLNIRCSRSSVHHEQSPLASRVLPPVVSAHQRPGSEVGEA